MPAKSSNSTIEESIKVALDAADTATNVAEEFNNIKEQFEVVNIKAKRIYQSVSIIFISSIAAAVIAICASLLMYFNNIKTLKDNSEMARESVAIIAENIGNLKASLSIVEQNTTNQEVIKETLTDLKSATTKATTDLADADKRYNAAIKNSVVEMERIINEFVQKTSSQLVADNNVTQSEVLSKLDAIKEILAPTGQEDVVGEIVEQKVSLEDIKIRLDEIMMLQKEMAAKMLEAKRAVAQPAAKTTKPKNAAKPQSNPLQLN